ncbi:MAG: hypothetical protein SFU91_03450 [Chloroherpetonaceae bacterium]|nr:hypothetical protein [Chloroherpetonaceae bacterium]
MKFKPTRRAIQILLFFVLTHLCFSGATLAQSASKLFHSVKRAKLTTVTSLRKSLEDTLSRKLDSIITTISVDFFGTAKFISQKGRTGVGGKNKLSKPYEVETLLERGFLFGESGKPESSYEVAIGKNVAFGRFQLYYDLAFTAPYKYFSWRQLDSLSEITFTYYSSRLKGASPLIHKIHIYENGSGLYEIWNESEKPEIFLWIESGKIIKNP